MLIQTTDFSISIVPSNKNVYIKLQNAEGKNRETRILFTNSIYESYVNRADRCQRLHIVPPLHLYRLYASMQILMHG